MTTPSSDVARLVGRARDDGRLVELTAREREIFGLMAEGISAREISRKLSLSPRAVETHAHGIFLKLGIPAPEDHRRALALLAFLRLSGV